VYLRERLERGLDPPDVHVHVHPTPPPPAAPTNNDHGEEDGGELGRDGGAGVSDVRWWMSGRGGGMEE
jgi:hypothetical protein